MSIRINSIHPEDKVDVSAADIEWLRKVIEDRSMRLGDLNYIFCSDDQLFEMNQKYLHHDTFTDIITFDYVIGKMMSGDIYISTDRVKENALSFSNSFIIELRRVMVHGLLHLAGQGDKTASDKKEMRRLESHYLDLRP